MNRRSLASPFLVVCCLAAPAAAQPAPDPAAPPAAAEPAPPPPADPAPAPTPPSTEPTVAPAPAVAPGTGQPPPPPPPAESTKAGAAPSPGVVSSKWSMTIYGFAEFDLMHDSTQSFTDSPGNGLIVRPDANHLAYNNGRTQTTARNSRLGVRMSAPESHGLRSTGLIEMDFMGNQPPGISEGSFVNNGTFRVRAAYAKIESDYVDMLAGQYYFLFGEQPFFFPMSIWYFGLPNQAFGRTTQFRLSHLFKTPAVNIDVAASAQRPPQRDSEVPDFQGGLKLSVNSWTGPHTGGSGYAAVDPLTVSVSGSVRHFRVNEFAATPTRYHTANGAGISIDAMIPVIPAKSTSDKGNALTLTGSYVTGQGIGDLIGGLSGGAAFPSLPIPTGSTTAPTYTPNIDGGLVQYDADGHLRTLDWKTLMAGIQYYLPPNGQVTIGANYTQGDSDNIASGLTGSALSKVMKHSQYFEAVALGDLTPAIRVGVAFQRLWQTFGDERKVINDRAELSIFFFF
jgi:hypothetical protein